MDRQHAFVPAGSTATVATARALKKGGLFAGACLCWLLSACSHGPQVRVTRAQSSDPQFKKNQTGPRPEEKPAPLGCLR